MLAILTKFLKTKDGLLLQDVGQAEICIFIFFLVNHEKSVRVLQKKTEVVRRSSKWYKVLKINSKKFWWLKMRKGCASW